MVKGFIVRGIGGGAGSVEARDWLSKDRKRTECTYT